jgi:hypothetical protein
MATLNSFTLFSDSSALQMEFIVEPSHQLTVTQERIVEPSRQLTVTRSQTVHGLLVVFLQ